MEEWRLMERRYQYGELRLGRIHWVYRIRYGQFTRGYNFGYDRYGDFFSENFGWLIGIFAYISVVLSAMQVALASDRLKGNG